MTGQRIGIKARGSFLLNFRGAELKWAKNARL